jgi:putative YphP/YqiW family bacilliredoxin
MKARSFERFFKRIHFSGEPMPYPEHLIAPMREDLTQYGIGEARTPADLDAAVEKGTVMVVLNSVCGCAAGKARPGIGLALKHAAVKPEKTVTVFAGADVEATAHLREKLSMFPPSSPSIALFRDGEPVWMMHRYQIENSIAPQIAENLIKAFDQYCAPQTV